MYNFDFLNEYFVELKNFGMLAESKPTSCPNECAKICKQGLEIAVKWIYSIDDSLIIPYKEESLGRLITTEEFRNIIDKSMYNKIDYIRKVGTIANTTNKKYPLTKQNLLLKTYLFL